MDGFLKIRIRFGTVLEAAGSQQNIVSAMWSFFAWIWFTEGSTTVRTALGFPRTPDTNWRVSQWMSGGSAKTLPAIARRASEGEFVKPRTLPSISSIRIGWQF